CNLNKPLEKYAMEYKKKLFGITFSELYYIFFIIEVVSPHLKSLEKHHHLSPPIVICSRYISRTFAKVIADWSFFRITPAGCTEQSKLPSFVKKEPDSMPE
ncbi:hypothetical protein PENTCL1PPCAC_12864, partial [Pristionchus entomophagus]